MNRKRYILAGVWLVLFAITSAVVFGGWREHAFGYWHGWGHMRDWGGSAPWQGHRYWQDDDAEGGWSGGPGWYGMQDGFGMMDGYGSWLQRNLSEAQREKVHQLQAESAQATRKLQQQLQEAQEKLQQLYASDKRDWQAIRTASHAMLDMQEKLLDVSIDLQQKISILWNDSHRKEQSRN